MSIELLKEKKHFLNELRKINSEAIECFQNHRFEGIDRLYESRDRILKILLYIDNLDSDKKNDSIIEPTNIDVKTTTIIKLEIKALVQDILSQDQIIFSSIEQEKIILNRELQDIGKNKKNVGFYKVKTNDYKVNEEY